MSRTHNQRKGDIHEEYVCEAIGARKTRGSGSQWRDATDGRQNHRETAFAFAFDGKSTTGKGVNVTRDMWDKAVEQAGAERPMLALRFYEDDTLEEATDLVTLSLDDFVEMREAALRGSDLSDVEPNTEPSLMDIQIRKVEGHRSLIFVDGREEQGAEVQINRHANGKAIITLNGVSVEAKVTVDGKLVASTSDNFLKQKEYEDGEEK